MSIVASQATSGYCSCVEMATSNAKMSAPGHRSVYLITLSQSMVLSYPKWSLHILMLKHGMHAMSHESSGHHFHMAIKLSSPARWIRIRNFVDQKYGIKLNFSDSHANYYTAYEYIVKEDPNFVLSSNHPDLSNGKAPKTTKATSRRRKAAKMQKNKKQKRLAAFDVVQTIQTNFLQQAMPL